MKPLSLTVVKMLRARRINTERSSVQLLRRSAGFTLVELIVAMAVSSIVVLATYTLFTTTSSTLYEADSLADTTDRNRFAIEQLRNGIAVAGSHGSPDTRYDKRVRPLGRNVDFESIYVFAGAAEGGAAMMKSASTSGTKTTTASKTTSTTTSSTEGGGLGTGGSGGASLGSPGASASDAIVVVGAVDYPYSFEITNVTGTAGLSADVRDHPRGLKRLARTDPFDVSPLTDAVLVDRVMDDVTSVGQARLLRIMDRSGFFQFAVVDNIVATTTPANTLTFNFDPAYPLHYRNNNELWGLDQGAESDIGYDAALLDAYAYYTRIDPSDSANRQLIRERIDLRKLVANPAAGDWSNWLPTDRERVVLVDRVVDFRVWFDCAGADGAVADDWYQDWAVPVGFGTASCMTASSRGSARLAHMRLSIRTDRERKDLRDYQFLSDGADPSESLQTIDIDGDDSSAARVVTYQIEFELPNYSFKNVH